jgi:hypothetical protein
MVERSIIMSADKFSFTTPTWITSRQLLNISCPVWNKAKQGFITLRCTLSGKMAFLNLNNPNQDQLEKRGLNQSLVVHLTSQAPSPPNQHNLFYGVSGVLP